MTVKRVIIVGAGCPLADAIAETLSTDSEIIGIAKREFESKFYDQKIIFDFLSETQSLDEFHAITRGIESFVVITCTGRFPLRKPLSDYPSEDNWATFESNVLGFTIPYRATISNARLASKAAYLTFGSVSQIYKYPKLSVFTAAKDALRAFVLTASHEESGHGVRFYHLNLSTLDQEKEACFTSRDAGQFLPCEDVAKNIGHLLKGMDYAPHFSEYNLYKHSDSYYKDGYYSRIPENR